MVANDESTFDLVNKINDSIEKTSTACRKVFDYFNSFSYLWTCDIHITFSEFLKGITSLSRGKQKRPPSKNFMSNRNTAKSIASLGSMLTPEAISNIERTFLSPYYQSLPKAEKELGLTPLLEDFDAEIGVYVSAREQIINLKNYQDVSWIRINLQPTIDILITLTNKLVWKFTSFLSNQIKVTLNELDQFLKRMEPDIEKITGEERDTETFMKIMRIFNEVSSKQQEMEIKFELMKKTIDLLKKYNRFDVYDLEVKFNQTPVRWSNLKSKVTLAKQRLGPTIQEESKLIIKDLKQFSIVIDDLYSDIMESYLFRTDCDSNTAADLLTKFSDRFNSLQNKADDLKQLQELLESDIVDFEKLVRSKKILFYLEQTWKAIGDIRKKHEEWKSIRWQKVNIKLANEETDKQLDQLSNLASEIHGWDIYLNIKQEILNIKVSLFVYK
jgi:dynein heavy chain